MTPFSAAEGCQAARTGFWGTVGRYDLLPERNRQISMVGLTECPADDFFVRERLIIRRIISRQHRIHATHVDTNFAINKSYLLAISKDPSSSLFYSLGLINSRLFSQMFIWFSEVAKRDDFPQLDIATVREFPYPPHQLHHLQPTNATANSKKPKPSINAASTEGVPTAFSAS